MTGDTNMKKENTINQEQEEMVFISRQTIKKRTSTIPAPFLWRIT